MDLTKVAGVIIAPSIGIARLGNSPDEFYIGPESVRLDPNPAGGFKDKDGRVKRQGARFRVYGVDKNGAVLGELTADDAQIDWTVHLANTKASWFEFHGRMNAKDIPRNKNVADRKSLNIDPGPRSTSGRQKSGAPYRFDNGQFQGANVQLGELRTDEDGRLIVLGGFGHSASVPAGTLITNYANNDNWHDDTSDGPVNAVVRLGDGREFTAAPSRVLCVPPKYTPEMENLVSLYDVMEYAWYGADAVPAEISFTRDVYPILRRIVDYAWVNALAFRGHGPGKPGDFFDLKKFTALCSNAPEFKNARNTVFKIIRDPNFEYGSKEATAQANYGFMPTLAGDNNGPADGDSTQWQRIRPSQYEILKRWAKGEFKADWPDVDPRIGPAPRLVSDLPVEEQPAYLTRAALLPCVGAAFYPGIEMTYVSEDKSLYSEPFRLRADIPPGGIVQYMACPWQADFYECNTAWWPIARPDDVVNEAEYESALAEIRALPKGAQTSGSVGEKLADRLAKRVAWDRGLVEYPAHCDPNHPGDTAMVELWSQLGFIVSKRAPNGERVFVETERDPYLGMDVRQAYAYLSNIDDHPEFLPNAKRMAQRFLAQAWAMQAEDDFPDTDRFFRYTEEAFDARLDQIYNELVEANTNYDPATDEVFSTREAVLYRILQMAPFNQNDGAWLHSIAAPGPIDEVGALLFGVWKDEVGDGNVGMSHCNLYTDLLRQSGIYLPDPRSTSYADDTRFLDSAFTVSVMELALAQFPQSFYPELLGFTLQLEWTVVSLKPIIQLLEYYGFDPHFYKLHVGIDNAASGHGAMAKQAVKLYLDGISRSGGEEAMQEAWRRIWNGWIAFGNIGTLGSDMQAQLAKPESIGQKIADIITLKKPYASLNHDDKRLGCNKVNDWFEDPPGFMKALVEGGFFVKGSPEQSSFFRLTGFNGPMFKVFTDNELSLWQEWAVAGCPQPGDAKPQPPVHPAVLMAETIETLQLRQVGAPGHAGHSLKGTTPDNKTVDWTVAKWFELIAESTRDERPASIRAFMQALSSAENGWITKGDADASPFVTQLLSSASPMGVVFNEIAANSGGLTHRQIAIDWIKKGCPMPDLNEAIGVRHTLARAPAPRNVFPRRRIRGQGAAH
ncbi:LodA/GoxA family CTQ-dependent oxidase [Caballeronia sp. BR00000012568055]|uniref:LodA/GoxA family CTQ-dependent oxidase n=1 Tax=Caballeronia sp. BR00000012568055 TaxID=2918761 RepID=UPI0023F8375F